jgi:UDPglucose 6-dehydrogenase/GDP-mannose 6-dehydrogenase
MNVSIIGTGYVGLVTGACLAEKGHRCVCVDQDASKIESIAKAIPPFHEPGLDDLLKRHVGTLLFGTTDLPSAVRDSDLTLIATGTPFDGKTIDLSYVEKATTDVGHALRSKNSYHVVAVKSTVVPGTTDSLVRPALERSSGKKAGPDFGVGMNPEFLSEGSAVEDFLVPDRIVLGGMDERTLDVLATLYSAFDTTPTLRTSNTTAEFIKYTSNALLATLISYANEIANLCSTIPGVDAADVMKGVHLMRELQHRARDGTRTPAGINSFIFPGCGFGGSCLPKDVKALSAWGAARGEPARLLDAVLKTNHDQPARAVTLLERGLTNLRGKNIAVLGLAFKPDTDDMRESPAVPIIDQLLAKGALVRAHDPIANRTAALALKGRDVRFCETLAQALDGIDAAVIVTRWKDYRQVPSLLQGRSPTPLLVDARRMLGRADYSRYAGIGLA